ncbi:MAG TPA: DUF4198 domain-containing protein [Ramlibacter sp.]|jgi:hypothetical protein|nr:DUF4198 domain-containing protein [Ramlibacter sp.]
MKTLLRTAFSCVAALAMTAAHAHEFWMLPGSFHLPTAAATTLSLAVGEDFIGEPVAFAPALIAGLRRVSAEGTEELDARSAGGALGPRILVRLPRAGTHLFALETQPIENELPAADFNEYLREEGLHAVRQARAAAGTSELPGRERYRRNIKTLVQVGGQSDEAWKTRVGQRLEIVPAADPLQISAPASLTLQLLFDAQPLAGALVKLWHGTGVVAERVTDASGHVTVPITRPGRWMASVVHMLPAPAGSNFDWDSYWGSLTFATRGGAQQAAGSGAPRR